ncbi:rCG58139 [Rattus norvegicus]|uniref:RCG58139 n=1 Tax=Rattus norvegicus TaxID=10116 RepID=A6J4U2_RAT|nr:rCG58139 [Rattus norvegicus]
MGGRCSCEVLPVDFQIKASKGEEAKSSKVASRKKSTSLARGLNFKKKWLRHSAVVSVEHPNEEVSSTLLENK